MTSCNTCAHRGVCFIRRDMAEYIQRKRFAWTIHDDIVEKTAWFEFMAFRCKEYCIEDLQDNAGA